MIFVQTQGHEALSLYWTFHGIVCCFLEFYCIGWINHTHRVVHDSFYFGSYSVKSECTLGNRHWCKAICRTGSLYIGQREWDPFATFFLGGGNPRRSKCAHSPYTLHSIYSKRRLSSFLHVVHSIEHKARYRFHCLLYRYPIDYHIALLFTREFMFVCLSNVEH